MTELATSATFQRQAHRSGVSRGTARGVARARRQSSRVVAVRRAEAARAEPSGFRRLHQQASAHRREVSGTRADCLLSRRPEDAVPGQ